MQWWNNFVDWFYSDAGQTVLTTAVIPFVAIVVAGVIAALIGRAAIKRLVEQRDRETRAQAVAALVAAGRSAARWHSLSPDGRDHSERLANDADVTVRLLPIAGSALAADWAAHQIADMRVNSVSFSFQADQTLSEYRDRMVSWVEKPSKARKLFAADLNRWAYEDDGTDPVVVEQQKWAAEQYAAATTPATTPAPVATPEVLADLPAPTPDAFETPLVPPPSPARRSTATTAAATAAIPTAAAPDEPAPES